MIPTPAHAGTTQSGAAAAESTAGSRHRVVALDALRGFALCGILLVNIPWQIVTIRMPQASPSGERYLAVELLEYLVHGRFFPIFSVLFGISFALFLDTAAARSRHPRLVLLRRLVVLGVLGVAHQQLHAGEALTPYAIFGILVLLPASWLPRWIVLPAAVVALAGGILAGGGLLLIPGLFLVGLATVRFGIIDTLSRRRKQIAVLFSVAVAAAIPATVWQATTWADPNGESTAAIAGLICALAYGTGLLLVLGTRFGGALGRFLAPLGRMALTNYVTATLIAAAAGPLLGLEHSANYGRMIALAVAILAAQAAFSRFWLARYQYGPLEWIWRCLTWWTRTGNRRVKGTNA
ncbi:DUF418 domain-containing protein [Dactylosporangium sp. McL0621]|uniref:DUF418 domain-containing protein n=1 Tax=Dactylosporangium sp. McL0621 TaxID=3415678 RepID=UPI003CEE27A7